MTGETDSFLSNGNNWKRGDVLFGRFSLPLGLDFLRLPPQRKRRSGGKREGRGETEGQGFKAKFRPLPLLTALEGRRPEGTTRFADEVYLAHRITAFISWF